VIKVDEEHELIEEPVVEE
jgi:hypothetical protein